MPRSSSLPALSDRRPAPTTRVDRLHIAVAAPIVVLLSLLCWAAVWEVARLAF